MSRTAEEIKAEIKAELAKARERVRQAEHNLAVAEHEEFEATMAPLKELVEKAHNTFCAWNHTDGCSWKYEETSPDPWSCATHYRWLKHYHQLIYGSVGVPAVTTVATVEAIIEAVNGLKKADHVTALYLLRSGKLTV